MDHTEGGEALFQARGIQMGYEIQGYERGIYFITYYRHGMGMGFLFFQKSSRFSVFWI